MITKFKIFENNNINCYGVKKGDTVIVIDDYYSTKPGVTTLIYGKKYKVHSVLHQINYEYKEKKNVDNENDSITLINPDTNREFRKSGGELVFKVKDFMTPNELEIQKNTKKYNL